MGDFKPDYEGSPSPFQPDSQIIANFECAISENFINNKGKAYPVIFKPSEIKGINDFNFSALNIANNHVYDAGDIGFTTLLTTLKQYDKTQIFGTTKSPYASININGTKCAIIGSLESCRSRGKHIFKEKNILDLIKKLKNQYEHIFITPHWGKESEYALYPSPKQRDLARQWIKAGASAVLGHHSHTVQGYEWVDSKPIFYSLGNALFKHEESKSHPLTTIGLAIKWDPNNSSENKTWEILPFHSINGEIKLLNNEIKDTWLKIYSNLSLDTKKNQKFKWINWARKVGPIYIAKCNLSWKKRFSAKSGFKSRLIWIVWTLLPINILLRIASYFPDSTAEKFKKEIETFVQIHINNN